MVTNPKQVILRAIGPSLALIRRFTPCLILLLRLFDSSGSIIASNDNWRSDQAQFILKTGLAPSDDREAALIVTLSSGLLYRRFLDASNYSGIALFELYDLDPPSSQLAQPFHSRLSRNSRPRHDWRLYHQRSDQPASFILRAIGPSLSQFGVLDALLDPILELHNAEGSLIFQNDNWRSDQEQLIIDSNLAPSDDRESAIIANLSPGSYSAIVRGSSNSTGTALVEIYRLSQ